MSDTTKLVSHMKWFKHIDKVPKQMDLLTLIYPSSWTSDNDIKMIGSRQNITTTKDW